MPYDPIRQHLLGEAAGLARGVLDHVKHWEAVKDALASKIAGIDEKLEKLNSAAHWAHHYSESDDRACPRCWVFGDESVELARVPDAELLSRHRIWHHYRCSKCGETYRIEPNDGS